MKYLATLAACLFFMSLAGTAVATIDWAGNVWPLYYHPVPGGEDLSIYIQVYKEGVTEAPGQGADITAAFFYTDGSGDDPILVQMAYNADVGDNDEYVGVIPQADFAGWGLIILPGFEIVDLTDGTTYPGPFPDQNGAAGPGMYIVIPTLVNDIEVTFTLCMSGEPHDAPPFLVGSLPLLGEWCQNGNLPVPLTQVDGDEYTATVVFPAGSNPNFSYKYQKVECDQWESVDNRSVILPTDGTAAVTLNADSWNNLPMGCGLEEFLLESKIVEFGVCMDGVDNSGGVCIAGNIPELGDWTGVPMTYLNDDYWFLVVTFPQGTQVPQTVEFKFLKDDCTTWESVGNRVFVVDNTINHYTTVDQTFDDGPGLCQPIATEETNWGSLKSMYR